MLLNRALKLLREYHRLKQVELASRLDISSSYLSEIESGDKRPTLDLLEKYSTVFNVPASSILLLSEELHTPSPGGKLRLKASDRLLRLLEWIADQDKVVHGA